MIDLAVFNSYIMFTALQQQHPQDPLLKRKGQYTQKDFRCELMRGLAEIDVDEPVPRYRASTQRVVQVRPHLDYQHQQYIQTLQQQMQQQQICHKQHPKRSPPNSKYAKSFSKSIEPRLNSRCSSKLLSFRQTAPPFSNVRES